MAKLERIYTIPLGEAYETVRNKRVPRAVKMLKAFASRHMKAEDGEKVLVSEALNKHLWENSIQRPPRKVKVRIIKDSGSITVYLSDEKIEEKKKETPKEDKPAAKKDEKPAQKEAPAAKKAETAKEEKK